MSDGRLGLTFRGSEQLNHRNARFMFLITFRSCSSSRTSVHTHDIINWRRGLADHARSREPLSPAIAKNRIKNPGRGGRNLRNRYLALEKSLRGKEALTRGRNDQQQIASTRAPATPLVVSSSGSSQAPTFRGFVVPTKPLPPESDGIVFSFWNNVKLIVVFSLECCMSGCAVCVYDLYEESLDAYKEALGALRKNLIAHNIPENEWPAHVQTNNKSGADAQPEKRSNVVMSAFEEMERRLKEKHAAQNAEPSSS